MNHKMTILGIAGSLRKGSYNKMLLNEAVKLAPENAEIKVFEIHDIPLYNQDNEDPMPKAALKLKEALSHSDAVLFVTPEYNYSIPGILKNVIDWGSRPYGENSWDDKPVAIMGASPGGFGTIRAQMQLRQTFIFTNMHPINKELFVSYAAEKFNEKGELIDEDIKKKISDLLKSLIDWTRRIES